MTSQVKVPIVAIVGRANVGKSSIFNALLGRRETIVAREEGTTRDSIFALDSYQGHNFYLVDTAGLKDAEDEFELTIQDQIAQAVTSADVIWVVIESDTVITEDDRSVARATLKSKKPTALMVNKVDKIKNFDMKNYQSLGIKDIFPVSATQRRGFEQLLDQLITVIPHKRFTQKSEVIRLAICGRPNVGKSQLFNAMLAKQQAIVSSRAGTTRDVNRSSLRYEGITFELMDTAGIRRSGKIERGVEKFSVLRTLAAIEESDICLVVMDISELNVALDQKIAGMIKDAGKGLILVVNKIDTIDEGQTYWRNEITAQIKHNYEFVPWASLVFVSSKTGENVVKIFDLVLDSNNERAKKIKTSELNQWLKLTTAKHPPAGLKSFTPKLNYMVQENDNPTPTFKIYGSHTRVLHWSYKRYLDRELRLKFGFSGTPIKFWFFEKHIDRFPKNTKTEVRTH